jgi:hypothetical protein
MRGAKFSMYQPLRRKVNGMPRVADGPLGDLVVGRDQQRARVRVQHAGVGELAGADLLDRLDDAQVLVAALGHAGAGDEQDLVRAGERGAQAGRVVVVGGADGDPERGETGGLVRVAHGDGDLVGGHGAQQAVDDKLTQLAGGGGNDDHRTLSSRGHPR